jgi:hypothetical protein
VSAEQASARGMPGAGMHDERRWVRAPTTLWRTAQDTLVLLPREAGTPLVVSGSAAVLWELLGAPITLAELASELAKSYGAEASVIATDVAPVLEHLQSVSAIEAS